MDKKKIAKKTDISKYLKDDNSDLAIGFIIAMILSLAAGVIAWVSCLGYLTVLLLPFFAGYLAGNYITDTGKSIIIAGIGAFVGAFMGGIIAIFVLDLVTYEAESVSLIISIIVIAIISLGASAFGGYVRSSWEKSQIKPPVA